MQYNVYEEIKTIIEITGETWEDLKNKYEATGNEEDKKFIVWNRRMEGLVLSRSASLKKECERLRKIQDNKIIKTPSCKMVTEEFIVPENYRNLDYIIKNKGNKITCSGVKDNDLIHIFKNNYGMKWSGISWEYLNTSPYKIENVACSLIYEVLSLGYGSKSTSELLQKTINKDYIKYTQKLIAVTEDNNLFLIYIGGRYSKADELQGMEDEALRLPASRQKSNCVSVPVSQYKAVEDFANLNGYIFLNNAKEAINERKQLMEELENKDNHNINLNSETYSGMKELLESLKDED